MVFTVNIKSLSFKQNILNIKSMLDDQVSTYAVLRYASDIPDRTYTRAMNILIANGDSIKDRRLKKLTSQYSKVAGAVMVMDEEFVETVECWVGFNPESDITMANNGDPDASMFVITE